MHYIKYKKWWDTKHFQQAGKGWLDNDFYCPFPMHTDAYKEYWDEQEHYIKNGYTHEGQRIPGLQYLYLNYCTIKDKKRKKQTIPDFWAVDVDYFENLEYVMGLDPRMSEEDKLFRPVGMSAAKSRQVGASLKGAVPILYNMCFVPFSFNYIGAYLEKDALKTLAMYMHYHNHAFKYTNFGKRFIERDSNKHYKVGYYKEVNGEKIPDGYQSELNIVTFMNDPEKGVGGGCDLFIIEESGLHPQLLQSVTYIEPACKDGDYTTGTILAYGAAGSEGQSKDFEKLHYSPSSYNFLSFDNQIDEEPIYDECGYFIPNYSCRKPYIDEDGNPDQEKAIAARDKELETLKKRDHSKYLEKLSQYPNSGKEMFGSRGAKRFDGHILDSAIAAIRKFGNLGTPVELFPDADALSGVGFKLSNKVPIIEYPTPHNADLNSCVNIFEFPDVNPPDNLYIASMDSYNQDSSQTTSLGCIYIYKRLNSVKGEGTRRVLVAEYLARPTQAFGKHEFYRISALLLQMYNAKCLHENEDHEVTPWFYTNNLEHLLADQPDIIRSIIPGSGVKRTKGIHADKHLIIAAENKIQRYLYEKLGDIVNEEGKITGQKLGVSRIPSLALLQELKEYTSLTNKNFDRVRTLGWLLLFEEEVINLEVKHEEDEGLANMLVDTGRFYKRKRSFSYQS